jgi:hypothetical protein
MKDHLDSVAEANSGEIQEGFDVLKSVGKNVCRLLLFVIVMAFGAGAILLIASKLGAF